MNTENNVNNYYHDSYSLSLNQSLSKYKYQWLQRDPNKLKIVNRRKIKLFQMINEKDDYFSEDRIRKRDPLLYEIYIGWRNDDSNINYNLPQRNMYDFILNQYEKESFKEELENVIKSNKEVYGDKCITEELNQIKKVNNNSLNKREDDADELIRLMFIEFLYSKEIFQCDYDSDLDNDKDHDDYDEDNYFNSD